ncbi:MAG: AAA family ATPase [Acidobacteriota bacterium]|nr:AAA family ATPase [Acidobacteriota bacterium]
MLSRFIESRIIETLEKQLSFFLLGPRQTGKTTTLAGIFQSYEHIALNLMETKDRLRYERDPSLLAQEVSASGKKHVFIDEIQKVPAVLDDIQVLIDRDKKIFALTGSSARKLRNRNINLLPGRALHFRMDPLIYPEYRNALEIANVADLKRVLKNGELPGILTLVADSREKQAREVLSSYVTAYLEEEIRAEALVRNLGAFSRFLKLAAEASGGLLSMRSMAQDIGVTHATISGHFQVLEDSLVVERVDSLLPAGERGKLRKASKYIFFDTGVRNAAAEVLGPAEFTTEYWGSLFEQWIGLSILRMMRARGISGKLLYWRDYAGREIDWVIDLGDRWIPIEVKWGENIRPADIRHLEYFIETYRDKAGQGFIVFTGMRDRKIDDRITALSFRSFLERIFS